MVRDSSLCGCTAPAEARKIKTVKSKAAHQKEEELLTLWIYERRRGDYPVTGEDIRVQASIFYAQLWEREKERSGVDPERPREWEPTDGWVEAYKKR